MNELIKQKNDGRMLKVFRKTHWFSDMRTCAQQWAERENSQKQYERMNEKKKRITMMTTKEWETLAALNENHKRHTENHTKVQLIMDII